MKTIKFSKLVFCVFCMVSLVFSCSGDDGEDGATGPPGSDGKNGLNGNNGVDGEDGANGENGTANVLYSDWLDSPVASENIMSVQANGSIVASMLSQEFLDDGIVLVYARSLTNPNVYILPTIGTDGISYYFRYDVQDINVRLFKLDATNIGTPSFQQYRYVLIPGGAPVINKSTGFKSAVIDYSKMSYEDVTAAFNIPN